MLYKLVLSFLKIYYSTFYRRGKHNNQVVPSEGTVILCANHRYWNDPFFLAMCVKRPLHFLAKKELFDNPIKKWVMEHLYAIPVSRDGNDAYSLKKSYEVIKSGEILCIFPEGTRNPGDELADFKPGIAALAIRTKTPIIPAYIKNGYKYFADVDVYFGEPFELSEFYGKKLTNDDYVNIANTIIAEKILRLRDENINEAEK